MDIITLWTAVIVMGHGIGSLRSDLDLFTTAQQTFPVSSRDIHWIKMSTRTSIRYVPDMLTSKRQISGAV
jgi:hypothetical protein